MALGPEWAKVFLLSKTWLCKWPFIKHMCWALQVIRKSGLAPEGSDIITYDYVDVGRHAGSGWLSLECLLKEARFLMSNNLDNDAQLLLASKRQNLVRSPPGPHRFFDNANFECHSRNSLFPLFDVELQFQRRRCWFCPVFQSINTSIDHWVLKAIEGPTRIFLRSWANGCLKVLQFPGAEVAYLNPTDGEAFQIPSAKSWCIKHSSWVRGSRVSHT